MVEIFCGYSTVRRPSLRPPIQRRVFREELVEVEVDGDGEDDCEGGGACSKAMRRRGE